MEFSFQLWLWISSPPTFLWVPVKLTWSMERQLKTLHSIFWDTTFIWGWPVDRRMLPHEIHTFWNYREDLSMENGLITKGARLIIPSTLRRKVLEQIHEGRLGIEKCMLKARDSVFWPGISNDIRETVEKCGICQASSKAAKSIGNVSDVPPHAWHTLGHRICSTGTRLTTWWLETTSPSTWSWEDYPTAPHTQWSKN